MLDCECSECGGDVNLYEHRDGYYFIAEPCKVCLERARGKG